MNEIILHGKIHDIEYSHTINGVDYSKALLETINGSGRVKEIPLKFKSILNPYSDGDEIDLIGYCRSYSHYVGDKAKVDVYIFTYFDIPNYAFPNPYELVMDGVLCRCGELTYTKKGISRIYFTIANNIKKRDTIINSYLPCVAFGDTAENIYNNYKVGDIVNIIGEFNSRQYEKDGEIRTANEIIVLFTNQNKEDELNGN